MLLEKGGEIIVTWYNSTNSMISFWKPLISFEDPDNPVNETGEPQWLSMSDYDWWKANDLAYGSTTNYFYNGDTRKTIYIVTDETGVSPGITPVEGQHSFINICANTKKKV